MLFELRNWQEKYNPIVAPIGPELYVDEIERAEDGKASDYPDIFPLFRLPADPRSGRQGSPPNYRRTNEFWQKLMGELENRWNASSPPEQFVNLVNRQKITGQASGAKYNPHGLRVSGLSLLVAQGVPFEVVSKLIAGHASILMTLYYIKYEPARIHDLLQEGAQKREAQIADGFVRDLKNLEFDQAQKMAASFSTNAIRQAVLMDRTDKSLWSNTGIGLCPWDGTRCEDGGPQLRKSVGRDGSDKSTYGPVEGGERNCVLCRHFITGPAWQNALWLYGTKLTRAFSSKAKRVEYISTQMVEIESKIEVLRSQRKEDVQLQQRLYTLETELNALGREQEILGKGIWSTQQLLEACAEIFVKEKAEASEAIVIQSHASIVEYSEVSDFEQAVIITAAGRIYPIIHDDEAEAARNRFLDAIMFHGGLQPLSFSPLSTRELQQGMDAFAEFIMRTVKAEELPNLADGTINLKHLSVCKEVAEVVSNAVGRPVFLT